MTLIIGTRCTDGVVLAADRRELRGFEPAQRCKIRSIEVHGHPNARPSFLIENANTITLKQLAVRLGIADKELRQFLRDFFPRSPEQKRTRYEEFTKERAKEIEDRYKDHTGQRRHVELKAGSPASILLAGAGVAAFWDEVAWSNTKNSFDPEITTLLQLIDRISFTSIHLSARYQKGSLDEPLGCVVAGLDDLTGGAASLWYFAGAGFSKTDFICLGSGDAYALPLAYLLLRNQPLTIEQAINIMPLIFLLVERVNISVAGGPDIFIVEDDKQPHRVESEKIKQARLKTDKFLESNLPLIIQQHFEENHESVSLHESLPPIENENATVLILGSVPGLESIDKGEYYANKRNQFWPIMGELVGAGPEKSYEERIRILKDRGIAVWDVVNFYDSSTNDIEGFLNAHPRITRVFFNGVQAQTLFNRYVRPNLTDKHRQLQYECLPSTSSAHATMSLNEKIERWRIITELMKTNGGM